MNVTVYKGGSLHLPLADLHSTARSKFPLSCASGWELSTGAVRLFERLVILRSWWGGGVSRALTVPG
jgi:hypothetical protein